MKPMTFVPGGKPTVSSGAVKLEASLVEGGKPVSARGNADLSASLVEGGKPVSMGGNVDLSGSFAAGGKPVTDAPVVQMGMPLSQPIPSTSVKVVNWSGMNRRHTIDTGVLSAEYGISTDEAPYLAPAPMGEYLGNYPNPSGLFGFGDDLVIINQSGSTAKITRRGKDGSTASGTFSTSISDSSLRCVVKFNHYPDTTNPASGDFEQLYLLFPDNKSFRLDQSTFDIATLPSTGLEAFPPIKYACVNRSRLFGIDDDRIYASGFNDYANWNLDTADESKPSNAWCSPTGANTRSGGKLNTVVTYQNYVVCFKDDFMHEIYNTKNPFRVQDVYAEGTIDPRSVQEVCGRLFFVDREDVKVYTGGIPSRIGSPLNIRRFDYAVAGSDGQRYYLYCESFGDGFFFVYDMTCEQWSQRASLGKIHSFAYNRHGLFAINESGNLYKVNAGGYDYNWHCVTDFTMGQTVDIKRIHKIQVFAEIDSGAQLGVDILYDDGRVQEVYSSVAKGFSGGRTTIRVIPRNTADYGFKIRFRGRGFVKIYSMEVFVSKGGEMVNDGLEQEN